MRVILFTNNLLPHLQRYVKQCKASTLQDEIAYAREATDTFKITNKRAVLQPFVIIIIIILIIEILIIIQRNVIH